MVFYIGTDDLADKALVGYLKIIVEINRRKEILDYRKDSRLTENNHIKFKVSMGFGLHAGWAIEGAVGSVQKVDATYLSPHVNMAARLESSSRQYGVPLLLSQSFYDLMSPDIQHYLRKLDVVTVKGSEVPIGIYTYDSLMNQQFATVVIPKRKTEMSTHFGTHTPEDTGNSNPKKKHGSVSVEDSNNHNNRGMSPIPSQHENTNGDDHARPGTAHKKLQQPMMPPNNPIFMNADSDAADVFEQDTDLLMLRSHVTEEFTRDFNEAIGFYLAGDWKNAQPIFEKCNMYMSSVPGMTGDGPSQTLLRYMDSFNFVAPPSWKGFRPLTSK